MIKIHIANEKSLDKWYVEQMSKIIMSQSLSKPTNSLLYTMFNELSSINEEVIYDILCLPCNQLKEKYPWINDYVTLCEFCDNYSALRKRARSQNHDRNHHLSLLKEYYDTYKGTYINQLLKQRNVTDDDILKSWKKMTKFVSSAQLFLKKMNDSLISLKFSYDKIPSEIRGEIVQRFNIPVCPYCNKQFINTYEKQGSRRYIGDIDHFLAKSTYALFSMSLWNLIPSCKSCNQTFKKDSHKQLLNPWFYGFDDDASLVLYYKDVRAMIGLSDNMDMKWETSLQADSDIRKLIQNNIDLFCLNETYEFHKKDIQIALYKRFKYSKHYSSVLSKLLGTGQHYFSYEKLIYGVSLDKRKFQEEPLSKAIFDAIFKN